MATEPKMPWELKGFLIFTGMVMLFTVALVVFG